MTNVMPNWFMKRAHLTPDRPQIITGDRTWTFREMEQKTAATARRLAAFGVRRGDVVALLCQNSVAFIQMIFALPYVGAKAVLLNTRLSVAELRFQVKDAGVSYLFYDTVNEEKGEQLSSMTRALSLTDLEKVKEADVYLKKTFSLNEVQTILYTSGTTGQPKGVMLTYGNHWWSAQASALNLGIHANDRWLCMLPFFHVSGLSILLRGVFYGTSVVLLDRFDPQAANEAIQRNGVTIASVVSNMLQRMTEQMTAPYPATFRCMLLGGGPCPRPLLLSCQEKNVPVYQTYGMTETASQMATLAPEFSLNKIGSAGKSLFPCELAIEKDGRRLGPGEVGEIIVRGPNVTPGYYRREEETKKAITADGWLKTGDLGELDEEGFLYVRDRRSDLIISGGENVYPAEIEAVLLSHPAVRDAGVAGVDDEKWGKVPVAYIVARRSVSEEEILRFCRKRLASYKIPRKIRFVQSLPRNAANKLVRHRLLHL